MYCSAHLTAFKRLSALALGLSLCGILTAEPVYYGPGQVPRPIDIARALAGDGFKPKMRMRGMDLGDNAVEPSTLAGAAPLTANSESIATPPTDVAPATMQAQAPGVAVAIAFAFDSAVLDATAYPVLDNLAEGIKLTDANARVVIEGHTDASGSEPYNQGLSERRAQSVRHYLIEHHGVAPARLLGIGRGESQLLLPNAPANAKNRRVQFSLG
jgi:outer membrane protein OmpA-like peptidoglycan-associated protein